MRFVEVSFYEDTYGSFPFNNYTLDSFPHFNIGETVIFDYNSLNDDSQKEIKPKKGESWITCTIKEIQHNISSYRHRVQIRVEII